MTGKTGGITYSSFGNGSRVGDYSRCYDGADHGPGASCSMEYDLKPGKWYTIESTVVQTYADGSHRWNGTLIEDTTGKRTYIASFITEKRYGLLHALHPNQWLEWYHFNGDGKQPADRICIPYFKVTFGKILARITGGTATAVPDAYEFGRDSIDDACAVAHNATNHKTEFNAQGQLVVTAGIYQKCELKTALNADDRMALPS